MPDDWEKKNGLNPKDPKDGNEDKGKTYTEEELKERRYRSSGKYR